MSTSEAIKPQKKKYKIHFKNIRTRRVEILIQRKGIDERWTHIAIIALILGFFIVVALPGLVKAQQHQHLTSASEIIFDF